MLTYPLYWILPLDARPFFVVIMMTPLAPLFP